jgi:hypothetical protein
MQELFGASTPNDTGHLRPTKRKLVDVFVSKDQLERALDFLDTLFKALEARGYRVDLAPFAREFRRLALDVREASKREYRFSRDGVRTGRRWRTSGASPLGSRCSSSPRRSRPGT